MQSPTSTLASTPTPAGKLDVVPVVRALGGRPPGPTIDPDRVAEALKQHRGMVYLAAQALKVDPSTIYDYRARFAQVRDALDTARGELLDIAESALYAAIVNREPWAVMFVLRTVGRHRGYVEKQIVEQTGPGGGPLQTVTVNALDLAKLSDDELEQYEKLVTKLTEAAQPPAAVGEPDGSSWPANQTP